MAEETAPQICLITPSEVSLSDFPDQLLQVLDAYPVACLRLALSSVDEDHICRIVDHLRDLCHPRDIPVIIETHSALVEPLGLDGVHLGSDAGQIGKLRRAWPKDLIIGAGCGASRHAGLATGEAGADYVSFGPVSQTRLGPQQAFAEPDLFAWWSEMIELPSMAQGHLDPALIKKLAPVVDFFAIGAEIWSTPDPVAAFKTLTAPL